MEEKPAALIVRMDPPPGEEREFESWYADEHILERMRVPGFLSAVRGWAVRGEPRHLAVYYVRSLATLEHPEYLELRRRPDERSRRIVGEPLGTGSAGAFLRFAGEEIGDTGSAPAGRYLYLVTFAVPAAAQAEVDAWYEQEHLPILLRNEDWLRCRRYAVADAVPPGVTRAAVHELADLAALDSPERAEARAAPWRARLAENAWFSTASYAVYERCQDFAG